MRHIGPHPTDEMYEHIHQHGGEIDCQCARCGSSCDHHRCEQCEDGWVPGDDDDDCYSKPCPQCLGEYVWCRCMSSRKWCEANPLPGREGVKRGEIEWYTFNEGGKT